MDKMDKDLDLMDVIASRKKEALKQYTVTAPSGREYVIRRPTPIAFAGLSSIVTMGLKLDDDDEEENKRTAVTPEEEEEEKAAKEEIKRTAVTQFFKNVSTREFEQIMVGIISEGLVKPSLPKRAIPDFVNYCTEDAMYLFNKLCNLGIGGEATDLRPFSG